MNKLPTELIVMIHKYSTDINSKRNLEKIFNLSTKKNKVKIPKTFEFKKEISCDRNDFMKIFSITINICPDKCYILSRHIYDTGRTEIDYDYLDVKLLKYDNNNLDYIETYIKTPFFPDFVKTVI